MKIVKSPKKFSMSGKSTAETAIRSPLLVFLTNRKKKMHPLFQELKAHLEAAANSGSTNVSIEFLKGIKDKLKEHKQLIGEALPLLQKNKNLHQALDELTADYEDLALAAASVLVLMMDICKGKDRDDYEIVLSQFQHSVDKALRRTKHGEVKFFEDYREGK